MIYYAAVSAGERLPAVHRHMGCTHLRRAHDVVELTEAEAVANGRWCHYCYPDDPVKRVLAVEGMWYRVERDSREVTLRRIKEAAGRDS